jgi:hypothetical protein
MGIADVYAGISVKWQSQFSPLFFISSSFRDLILRRFSLVGMS